MSPVPSRYIRAIYLLPGVKCGSEAKREKGASQAAEKEDNCCRSCGTVSLFYCCKLGSCIVVLLYCCLFLCWLG